MSYYIPLPDLDAAGLGKAWDGLDVVSRVVLQDDNFHIAAPMEFRFVKGGNTAMSGTFADDPANTWFVNLDLIGFVEKDLKASDYPAKLLQFFADIEREWVAMGGFPHQGKMYGFYDPTAPPGTHTAPFNVEFLAELRRRRGDRLQAFNEYRKSAIRMACSTTATSVPCWKAERRSPSVTFRMGIEVRLLRSDDTEAD